MRASFAKMISGSAPHSRCCLKYEQDAYEDLIRTSPKAESFVDTPDGRGTVIEVDLLRQRVKVKMEDQPEVIAVYSNTDIAVLRNGKAKKNDPPIPADLAPISGNGKRPRREKEEDSGRMFLDPIKFRYSTETIVEEDPPAEEIPELAEEAEHAEHKANRPRRRKPKSKSAKASEQDHAAPVEKPKQEPKPAKPKAEQPAKPKGDQPAKDKPAHPQKAAEGNGEKTNKPHRRPNHHRRRKPKPAGEGKPHA